MSEVIQMKNKCIPLVRATLLMLGICIVISSLSVHAFATTSKAPSVTGTYGSGPTLLIYKQNNHLIDAYYISFTDRFIDSYKSVRANLKTGKYSGTSYVDEKAKAINGKFTFKNGKFTMDDKVFSQKHGSRQIDQSLLKRVRAIPVPKSSSNSGSTAMTSSVTGTYGYGPILLIYKQNNFVIDLYYISFTGQYIDTYKSLRADLKAGTYSGTDDNYGSPKKVKGKMTFKNNTFVLGDEIFAMKDGSRTIDQKLLARVRAIK
jgi:hypothetical protein